MKKIDEMNIEEVLVEINKLAKKNKLNKLTKPEQIIREKYRARYLELYRETFLSHLKTIKIVDKQGNDVTPDKLKKLKQIQGGNHE